MTPDSVLIGVLTGCALIVFGVVPGLLENLTDGVRNLSNSVSNQFLTRAADRRARRKLAQPTWLAGLGVALIVLTILGYTAR